MFETAECLVWCGGERGGVWKRGEEEHAVNIHSFASPNFDATVEKRFNWTSE